MRKSSFDVKKMLRDATLDFGKGNLSSAKQLCEGILQKFPLHAEANFLLGRYCYEMCENESALTYLQISFNAAKPRQDQYTVYYNVLEQLFARKQHVLMERASLWLTQFCPGNGRSWDYLGIAYIGQERFLEAQATLLKALELLPDNVNVLINLGNSLISLERYVEAIEVLRKANKLSPSSVVTLNNLGNALKYIADSRGAIATLSEAISLAPDQAYLYSNLGQAYVSAGNRKDGIANYNKALTLDPNLIQVYPNLVEALRLDGKLSDALTLSELALSLNQEIPEIWAGYGDVLRDLKRLDASLEAYMHALSMRDDQNTSFTRRLFTNLLFCLNYHPDMTPEAIFSAYQEFERRFAAQYRDLWRPHNNVPAINKRLKVGYLTASFCNQVCKFFMLPLFEHHDKEAVEIYAYANPSIEDEITEQYKNVVDHWVRTNEMTDDQLVERIRADGIDILVDVAGHTAENRLLVFARKPAPVSMHWLEYGYTTGLTAIDYYLADKPGVTDDCQNFMAEKLWCLDRPPFSFRPNTPLAEVSPLPAEEKGFITFGCLSRAVRINYRVVRVWAAILDAMPNSRLIINSGDFKDKEAQENMAAEFAVFGIDRSRLDIGFTSPVWGLLSEIDIGLDCFPHNSGVTLLETILMGVPFISLADRPTVGRIGSTVLHAIGHPEWIATNEAEYAQKAIMLAHDINGLKKLRANLRSEMQASKLMDEVGFARSLEETYRQMWQIYCEEQKT
ncbi:MAG: tetratricopeptide repeat protein [Undibacterium sp.]|nr:tetratricopeptide repeat protein [Undibacterium sp.]